MADVLTGPLATAALVLLVAGIAKLRSPAAARDALGAVGLKVSWVLVRAFAGVELVVGITCLVRPVVPATVAVACLYAGFAALAAVLARRRASCGCFGGGSNAPASRFQAALSGVLALVSVAAAVWQPHGIGWVFARQVPVACVSAVALAGCAYATVLLYTELPRAWASWSRS